jgi:hypothetical protein
MTTDEIVALFEKHLGSKSLVDLYEKDFAESPAGQALADAIDAEVLKAIYRRDSKGL